MFRERVSSHGNETKFSLKKLHVNFLSFPQFKSYICWTITRTCTGSSNWMLMNLINTINLSLCHRSCYSDFLVTYD